MTVSESAPATRTNAAKDHHWASTGPAPALEEVRSIGHEKTGDSDDRQVAQVTVRGKGILLRAEERTDDIFAAYDTALEKLNRQIARYKGRDGAGTGDVRYLILRSPPVAQAGDSGAAFVSRRWTSRPSRLHLLSHDDFFVFGIRSRSGNVTLPEKDAGLIETDVT
jgi:putative sigma-54 modulation protein